MMLIPLLLVPVAVAGTLLLLRSGVLVRILFLLASLLLLITLFVISGTDRALAPLLLLVSGLALLLPGAPAPVRSRARRVAPRRNRQTATESRADDKTPYSFDEVNVPGYEILERVGSGGMASVYRGRRKSDGQIVALKVPMDQYVADARFIRRFHREAEVAQRLDHVNIVRTFEHGSNGARHYMVMEYVDGRSLESYIEKDDLDIELAGDIMKYVVDALVHIHEAGIVHRDIKPANIMILKDGVTDGPGSRVKPNAVKLMDFGIAGGKILSRLTVTGARVGTPVYMSPEQARGVRIDHRSDIYSLGLVFYEMLTGDTAFKGGYEAIVHQQIFQTPPPPRQVNLKVNRKLDELIMLMLSKEPDGRPDLQEIGAFLETRRFKEEPQQQLSSRIIITTGSKQGVVRILDTEGMLHSSVGEIGVGEGTFSAAPIAVTCDAAGNFYTALFEYRTGQGEHRMIRKLSPEGRQLNAFGKYGMKPGEFLYPASLTIAADGSVYILDSETHLVQHFDADGNYLSGFGGKGTGQGLFNGPRVIVAGRDGSLYVLDHGNRQVQRFNAAGEYETHWAFRQGDTGLRELDGLAVDSAGNLYISDASTGKIHQITKDSRIVRSFKYEVRQGEETDALLDLGVDAEGCLYAGRRGGHLIRKFNATGELTDTIETYTPLVQMLVDAAAASGPAAPGAASAEYPAGQPAEVTAQGSAG